MQVLVKPCVFAESEVFEFFIRAKNRDTLAHVDVPVEIYVMGAEDQPPTFDRELYRFSVLEDCAVSTVVGTVSARSNASITYRYAVRTATTTTIISTTNYYYCL